MDIAYLTILSFFSIKFNGPRCDFQISGPLKRCQSRGLPADHPLNSLFSQHYVFKFYRFLIVYPNSEIAAYWYVEAEMERQANLRGMLR